MRRLITSPWLYLLMFWFGGIALSAVGLERVAGLGWAGIYAGLWLMVTASLIFKGLSSDG